MSENRKASAFEGGIVAMETPMRYEVPKHVKNINGRPVNENIEIVDVFDEFDDGLVEEVEKMPTSLLKKPEDMPEMPEEFERPKKSNAGRKPRKPREELHASLEMVDKKKALHEAKVLEITFAIIVKKKFISSGDHFRMMIVFKSL